LVRIETLPKIVVLEALVAFQTDHAVIVTSASHKVSDRLAAVASVEDLMETAEAVDQVENAVMHGVVAVRLASAAAVVMIGSHVLIGASVLVEPLEANRISLTRAAPW
jgi:S-methylmethionine-dependent homocysteine/selenocysteine methylase